MLAVVTSDNHLGVYYARFRPDRLELRRRRLQDAFRQVVDAAIARRADLFLHAGDLFDRADPRNADRVFVARQVRRLQEAGIPVIAIVGNHDSPRGYGIEGVTPHEEIEALGAIRLLRDTDALQAETLVIDGRRVCIWGLSSDFNRPPDVCPLQDLALRHERGGDIDLILLHYGVEGWAQPFAAEPCLSLANLDHLRAEAVCVGHLHARNEMRLPSGSLLLNPGATEHIHFGEENLPCGFFALHIEPGNAQAEYVALPTQPMRTAELDLSEFDMTPDPEADVLDAAASPIMRGLSERIERVSHPDQLLRVRLKGRLLRSQYHAMDSGRLQALGGAANFHCQLDSENLALYDKADGWSVEVGFSFDVRQELQSNAATFLAANADDPQEQAICRLAGQELDKSYERLTGGTR